MQVVTGDSDAGGNSMQTLVFVGGGAGAVRCGWLWSTFEESITESEC